MGIFGLVTGFLLGLVLREAGFSRPAAIRDMLALRDLHLVKILLTGVGTAVVLVYTTTDLVFLQPFVKPLHWGVLIGGVLFGGGLAAAGYCPGTALIAVGEKRGEGMLVFAAGLMGVLLYAALYPGLPIALGSGGVRVTVYSMFALPQGVVALVAGLGTWVLSIILTRFG